MTDLANYSNIRAVLERNGFNFKKSLGQNFLINPTVCPRMADAAVKSCDFGVLEIGPGVGVLTAELAQRASKVVSIEIDRRLQPVLAETMADYDNVKIIFDDFMRLDAAALISNEFGGMPVAVCANLPYYITSPIIMRLLESRLPIDNITVMVQKEAADRLCAAPGTRQCGAVSVAVSYYSQPKVLFQVSRGSFMPPPNVDSSVIQLSVLGRPPVKVSDEKGFFTFIKASFSTRRKTLSNAVGGVIGCSKAEFAELLGSLGIPSQLRAEQLTLEQFAAIYNRLNEEK